MFNFLALFLWTCFHVQALIIFFNNTFVVNKLDLSILYLNHTYKSLIFVFHPHPTAFTLFYILIKND